MVKKFNWYPTGKAERSRRTKKVTATKLRKGIEAGSVLILTAGRFRGKRVVFLKQLASGLLLVTGPRKVNGVPLRRVNQVYTIRTSTKVSTTGVDVSGVTDKTFTAGKKKSSGRSFFNDKAPVKKVSDERAKLQTAVDAKLLENIKKDKTPLLKQYLRARFTLTKNDRVHEMKF